MIKDKLIAENWDVIKEENPHVTDDYAVPRFKKGDVLWQLIDTDYRPDSSMRYRHEKVVIAYGEPKDDYSYGWTYKIAPIEDFEKDRDYSDKNYNYYEGHQIFLFERLKDLKKFAKCKVNKRIEMLNAQLNEIDSFKDEQEYREEQIDSIVEE